MYIQKFCISYIQKILSDVKNREMIIKNTKSYIYRYSSPGLMNQCRGLLVV